MSERERTTYSYMADGHLRITHNYGQDVGNLHVIDYRLWLADLPIRRSWPGLADPRSLRISPADWTR